MKTYLVNLDKNKDRMEYMDAQLNRLGIQYERIPAVYGASLTKRERKERFSLFRSFCAMGYKLSPGAIGCSLSHCSIYKKMIEENVPYALVLEDDIVIDPFIKEIIVAVGKFVDESRPQVILLSAISNDGTGNSSNIEIMRVKSGMCTDGYVITQAAAKLILRVNYPVVTTADSWRRWVRIFGLELYKALPATVQQDNDSFGSDINRFGWDLRAERRAYWMARIMRPIRALELAIDYAIYLMTGK